MISTAFINASLAGLADGELRAGRCFTFEDQNVPVAAALYFKRMVVDAGPLGESFPKYQMKGFMDDTKPADYYDVKKPGSLDIKNGLNSVLVGRDHILTKERAVEDKGYFSSTIKVSEAEGYLIEAYKYFENATMMTRTKALCYYFLP